MLLSATGCVEDRGISPGSDADGWGGETGGAPAAVAPPAGGLSAGDRLESREEASDGACGDGRDNDGDRFVDCADYDCCGWADCGCDGSCVNRSACRVPVSSPPWVDEDPDGGAAASSTALPTTDLDATAGALTIDAEVDAVVSGAGGSGGVVVAERTETVCSDGLDDDEDGFVDCLDYDCCGPDAACGCAGGCAAARICSRSEAGVPTVESRCADGLDDDEDGFVDCLDYDCCGPDTTCGCVAGCEQAWACQ